MATDPLSLVYGGDVGSGAAQVMTPTHNLQAENQMRLSAELQGTAAERKAKADKDKAAKKLLDKQSTQYQKGWDYDIANGLGELSNSITTWGAEQIVKGEDPNEVYLKVQQALNEAETSGLISKDQKLKYDGLTTQLGKDVFNTDENYEKRYKYQNIRETFPKEYQANFDEIKTKYPFLKDKTISAWADVNTRGEMGGNPIFDLNEKFDVIKTARQVAERVPYTMKPRQSGFDANGIAVYEQVPEYDLPTWKETAVREQWKNNENLQKQYPGEDGFEKYYQVAEQEIKKAQPKASYIQQRLQSGSAGNIAQQWSIEPAGDIVTSFSGSQGTSYGVGLNNAVGINIPVKANVTLNNNSLYDAETGQRLSGSGETSIKGKAYVADVDVFSKDVTYKDKNGKLWSAKAGSPVALNIDNATIKDSNKKQLSYEDAIAPNAKKFLIGTTFKNKRTSTGEYIVNSKVSKYGDNLTFTDSDGNTNSMTKTADGWVIDNLGLNVFWDGKNYVMKVGEYSDKSESSVYGVWDNDKRNRVASAAGTERAKLLPPTITTTPQGKDATKTDLSQYSKENSSIAVNGRIIYTTDGTNWFYKDNNKPYTK